MNAFILAFCLLTILVATSLASGGVAFHRAVNRCNGVSKTVERSCDGSLKVHVERPLRAARCSGCAGKTKTVDVVRDCTGVHKTVTVE